MTQQAVYNLLKKEKDWISAKEIAKKIKASSSAITNNLKQMFKYGEVMKKTNHKSKHCWSSMWGSYLWKIRE